MALQLLGFIGDSAGAATLQFLQLHVVQKGAFHTNKAMEKITLICISFVNGGTVFWQQMCVLSARAANIFPCKAIIYFTNKGKFSFMSVGLFVVFVDNSPCRNNKVYLSV